MGMFREPGSTEIDVIKEMAESLGSTGIRLEEHLEKAVAAKQNIEAVLAEFVNESSTDNGVESIPKINELIVEYNSFVDKAEDALRWLLIQREACGFRTHKNVNSHYPIPCRMRLLKP
jgi:hypothetical protein